MLGVVEKVMWGLFGLFGVALVAAFVILGVPSNEPYIATNSVEVDAASYDKMLGESGKKVLGQIAKANEEADKNKQTGRQMRREKKRRVINQAMYERISTEADAYKEANKADGEMKDGRWVISAFGENNMFERLGFAENDEIERINGLPIDMGAGEAWSAYRELKASFDAGEPIVVSLRRKGKPIELYFAKER